MTIGSRYVGVAKCTASWSLAPSERAWEAASTSWSRGRQSVEFTAEVVSPSDQWSLLTCGCPALDCR